MYASYRSFRCTESVVSGVWEGLQCRGRKKAREEKETTTMMMRKNRFLFLWFAFFLLCVVAVLGGFRCAFQLFNHPLFLTYHLLRLMYAAWLDNILSFINHLRFTLTRRRITSSSLIWTLWVVTERGSCCGLRDGSITAVVHMFCFCGLSFWNWVVGFVHELCEEGLGFC